MIQQPDRRLLVAGIYLALGSVVGFVMLSWGSGQHYTTEWLTSTLRLGDSCEESMDRLDLPASTCKNVVARRGNGHIVLVGSRGLGAMFKPQQQLELWFTDSELWSAHLSYVFLADEEGEEVFSAEK